MDVSDEKRLSGRLTVLGDLFGEVVVPEPMLIKDVSISGATIDTRFPLQLDSLHDLRLQLGDRSVVVKGRVIHSHIADVDQDVVVYRTGIEFVEPSHHATQAIAQFLETVAATRAGH